MLGFLRGWRRRRVLATQAIDDALWDEVVADLPALTMLDDDARRRLRELALLFLAEKALHGVQGLELDDAKRLRIAVLACRPILELGLDCYAGFVSVVVHPDEFVARGREYEDDDGIVHVGDEIMSGESWEAGPVVLAWQEVLASGRGDGFDVVAHEFAHKLDLLDGAMNGVPPLPDSMSAARWARSFQAAYDELVAREARGESVWLDPYAAESPAEFFAVSTEMFFDLPREFCRHYPAVYAELAAFYRQDPAG